MLVSHPSAPTSYKKLVIRDPRGFDSILDTVQRKFKLSHKNFTLHIIEWKESGQERVELTPQNMVQLRDGKKHLALSLPGGS